MKRWDVSLLVLIGLLVAFLFPSTSSQISAWPENLWTNFEGGWSRPTLKDELMLWERREYGWFKTWLVVDREASGPAFYARVDPKYLGLQFVMSLGLTIVFYSLFRKRRVGEAAK